MHRFREAEGERDGETVGGELGWQNRAARFSCLHGGGMRAGGARFIGGWNRWWQRLSEEEDYADWAASASRAGN
jgi:hypothetical protein